MAGRIERVFPTKENATRIVAITARDLLLAGLPESEVPSPEDPKAIREQQAKLVRHPERYVGAFAASQVVGGKLLGVVKYNEWRKADQEPYGLSDHEQSKGQHLPGRPLGIFALGTLIDDAAAHFRTTQLLLDRVANTAITRQVCIGLHEADPAKEVALHYGFSPTGKIGEPYSGIPQELHVLNR